ncbi:hypothetical protein J2Y45_003420 [Dyadobacter sp. BE34]|uniref:Uncharacterized protein n=1 Tax=Dyadobacter fermentans TaxID=94254 RepID=A0ABU1QYQ2_9BACT|nr:hypothetical protein [Dyadobacter fermentans]MDR7043969.1 hypothetical protein [Dyadobacter sp. BE242]MDR7198280.1 hypothetical protein [Dyadobacter sp. BE34]MDR7216243.1 hypothetical protein [Dyadobacter sp. BE31]MDR7264231.1 hypothetical protein [Dyadobacter sp. BE32]
MINTKLKPHPDQDLCQVMVIENKMLWAIPALSLLEWPLGMYMNTGEEGQQPSDGRLNTDLFS